MLSLATHAGRWNTWGARGRVGGLVVIGAVCALTATGSAFAQPPDRAALEARVAALAVEVERLEDQREIETLQRTYGYFVDKNLWRDVADLFTEDGTLEIGGRGIFVGPDRVQEYMEWLGEPQQGRLYDHTQMQGVITVSSDGQTAKGRWRAYVFGGNVGGMSIFGDCIYENEYRKEDGVWKISKLHSYFIMYTDMARGWGEMGWPNTRPETRLPPDLPPTVVYDMYPGELTAPMHYGNPVTGASTTTAAGAAAGASGSAAGASGPAAGASGPAAGSNSLADGASDPAAAASEPAAARSETALAARLEVLRERLERLEDAKAVERLHNIYGYYLDDRQWDDVAALFAADGTLEIGQRGVYVGPERIRESLDLIGAAGPQHGEIESRPQYQHVVHVAPDGQSAQMRAREFLFAGVYGEAAYIGGTVYENEYVKEGEVWKIRASHPFTTFHADYERGWARGALPMPGVSEELPPDQPPSIVYEAFPAFNLLPPFHYSHPVTGRPVGQSAREE